MWGTTWTSFDKQAESGRLLPASRQNSPYFLYVPAPRWSRNDKKIRKIKKDRRVLHLSFLCRRYLSSRSVSRQVFSAEASLTSVFGMGTGGPSP